MKVWSASFALIIGLGIGFLGLPTGNSRQVHAQVPLVGPSSDEESQPEESKTAEEASPEQAPSTLAPIPAKNDEEIRNQITTILGETEWYKNVEVTVKDGVVILEGQTGEDEHKAWATQLAERTENVVAVINHIQVGSTVVNSTRAWTIVGESLMSIGQDFLTRLPLFAAGLIVLILTWVSVRVVGPLVQKAMTRSRLRSSLQDLFLQLTSISIWIMGSMIAAVVVFPGMTPSKMLTVLGLGSVAIGFAFKDIFENFFAGVLILWRFPFDKRDFIECGSLAGRVEDITVRNTMIRQVDGQLVIVPNAMLFKNPVNVLTNWKSRRVTVICGIAYGENVGHAREVIHAAVKGCKTVHQEWGVEIFAREFGSSSINFEVTWWTGNTPLDIRRSRDEVVEAVKRDLDESGIEIPFPYQTLTFKEPLPIRRLPEGENV